MDLVQAVDCIVSKGEIGESALNNWFKEQNLLYIALNQSQDTFSKALKKSAKRPDFLLLIEGIGMIAVDAKNHKLSNNAYTINVDKELTKGLSFERLFRLPIWYAYYESPNSWYWINAIKALEVGSKRINESTKDSFLVVPRDEFEHIQTAADLAKLFTHTLAK